jgi:hypothetical protein
MASVAALLFMLARFAESAAALNAPSQHARPAMRAQATADRSACVRNKRSGSPLPIPVA